jgi:hypothetical protein
VHEQWSGLTAAKDLDGLLEHIAPDIVSYEHAGPLHKPCRPTGPTPLGGSTCAQLSGVAHIP